ncbi:MAG: cbb3-type cytochrome c oxidase subunit II [Chthoniobacteraceae bacterium]
MRFPFLFAGIFATFSLAWLGETVIPSVQLRNLQPQTEEDGSDPYPVNNSGVAARGRKVYVSEGCIYCHTQQVRPEQAGSDIERGWGKRRTVARDYIYDNPVVLGTIRNGPDLANMGDTEVIDPITQKPRWQDAAWQLKHLYDPRSTVEDSAMPSYKYLFEKRKIASERSDDALKLDGDYAVESGYEVVPTTEAKDLVAYLLSLNRSHPLKEVKEVKQAKPEAPAK